MRIRYVKYLFLFLPEKIRVVTVYHNTAVLYHQYDDYHHTKYMLWISILKKLQLTYLQ